MSEIKPVTNEEIYIALCGYEVSPPQGEAEEVIVRLFASLNADRARLATLDAAEARHREELAAEKENTQTAWAAYQAVADEVLRDQDLEDVGDDEVTFCIESIIHTRQMLNDANSQRLKAEKELATAQGQVAGLRSHLSRAIDLLDEGRGWEGEVIVLRAALSASHAAESGRVESEDGKPYKIMHVDFKERAVSEISVDGGVGAAPEAEAACKECDLMNPGKVWDEVLGKWVSCLTCSYKQTPAPEGDGGGR